jgi:hypothetical protein
MILRLLCLAALLAGMSAAYEGENEAVSFSATSKVGAVVVPPGLYRLKVQGSVLFLTGVDNKKSFSTLVRVERTTKKSPMTAALGKTVEGANLVESIVLQGQDYRLVF